jgi:hypothetical protein
LYRSVLLLQTECLLISVTWLCQYLSFSSCLISLASQECALAFNYTWLPADAEIMQPSDYFPNPLPTTSNVTVQGHSVTVIEWVHLSGRTHAVAYTVLADPSNPCHQTLVLSLSNATYTGAQDAVTAVNTALTTGMDVLAAQHSSWWNNFYPRSMLTFAGDAKMEQLYYISVSWLTGS